jgi:hypothetical protein
MAHDCVQTRRLFILERDITAESAKRVDQYGKILETLERIGKAIGNLGENTAGDLKALRKEVSGLARVVKKG